ncbi:hypothetical protein BDQ17DRAFT_1428503 [Cyathus striatus]|nr:hypothetical protein BDQ17DRAFT_1428503 [Cyathus striatus]
MARDQSSPLPQQAHQAPISSSVASSIAQGITPHRSAQAGSSSRQTPPPSSATSSSTLPGPSQSTSSPDSSSTALLAATECPLENINTADGQADTVQPPVTDAVTGAPPRAHSPRLSMVAPEHVVEAAQQAAISLHADTRVSSRVDDAFLNWEYVPYTALTHSARVKSSKGEEEFIINGKGGLSAKTLERATEKDISLEDWLCASKIAVELERVRVHHGIGRASALEQFDLLRTPVELTLNSAQPSFYPFSLILETTTRLD